MKSLCRICVGFFQKQVLQAKRGDLEKVINLAAAKE
jgi:hypothetical protein